MAVHVQGSKVGNRNTPFMTNVNLKLHLHKHSDMFEVIITGTLRPVLSVL